MFNFSSSRAMHQRKMLLEQEARRKRQQQSKNNNTNTNNATHNNNTSVTKVPQTPQSSPIVNQKAVMHEIPSLARIRQTNHMQSDPWSAPPIVPIQFQNETPFAAKQSFIPQPLVVEKPATTIVPQPLVVEKPTTAILENRVDISVVDKKEMEELKMLVEKQEMRLQNQETQLCILIQQQKDMLAKLELNGDKKKEYDELNTKIAKVVSDVTAVGKSLQQQTLNLHEYVTKEYNSRIQTQNIKDSLDQYKIQTNQLQKDMKEQESKTSCTAYALAIEKTILFDQRDGKETAEFLEPKEKTMLIYPTTVDQKGNVWIGVRRIFDTGAVADFAAIFFSKERQKPTFEKFCL